MMHTWNIHRGRGKVTEIVAEYVVVQGAMLVFRTFQRGTYPQVTAVVHLAPGQWVELQR
jgi:hypothetical protein